MHALKLHEKAILVKLTIKRPRLLKRDEEAEAIIQNNLNDASLMVNSKLFRDKDNPIAIINANIGAVYTNHKKLTTAYADAGPRILAFATKDRYTEEHNQRIYAIDRDMQRWMPEYDNLVQQDIRARSQGENKRATVADYPTADEFQAATKISIQFLPIPQRSHFLFDMSEEETQAFADREREVEDIVRRDVVGRMLAPLKHLSSILAQPIGAKGSIFRDSSVDNILDGIEQVRELNMFNDDPGFTEVIRDLTEAVARRSDNVDWLRQSPIVRKEAQQEFTNIAAKMAAFMGGA